MADLDKPPNPVPPAEPSSLAATHPADAPAQSAPTTPPGEPPDIEKLVRYGFWHWLVSRVGRKWAVIIFIVIFIVTPALWWVRPYIPVVSNVIAEHLPLPKANPTVFTVAILPLENDDHGQIEHDIVEGLKEVQGIDVLEFSRQPISDSDVSAGFALGHEYLK